MRAFTPLGIDQPVISRPWHEMKSLRVFLDVLRFRSMDFLKALELIDDAEIKARAFERLQQKLLRLSGVEAICTYGFAKSLNKPVPKSEVNVFVIVSEFPPGILKQDIDKIVLGVNHRYGTSMKVFIANR